MLEEYSSSKQLSSCNQDIPDIHVSSNKEDIPNKQVRPRKQKNSRKQASSKKKDCCSNKIISVNLKKIDPVCLMEKVSELYNSEYFSSEQFQAARKHAKEVLNELLRVRAIKKDSIKLFMKNVNSNCFLNFTNHYYFFIIETNYPNNKLYCAQNHGNYCSDCNKSYIPNNYSNQLKTKGHNINVMKKRCCSCNYDITHSNNHDLTCSTNSVSLESNDSIITDSSNVKKS